MSMAKAFIEMLVDDPPPCVEVNDPELFFPVGFGDEHNWQIRQAKSVCRKCPITTKMACLEFALETNDQHGILAEKTPAEREVIRKKRADRKERWAA